MKTHATTKLDCTPERAWTHILRPELLQYVSWPLTSFTPLSPGSFPPIWDDRRYLVSLRAFGILPLGKQWIDVSKPTVDTTPEKQVYQIRDDGERTLVSIWYHMITIRVTDDGSTHYTDEIEVDAGMLTALIWLWANIFYRYRQYRLRQLAKQDFEPLSMS